MVPQKIMTAVLFKSALAGGGNQQIPQTVTVNTVPQLTNTQVGAATPQVERTAAAVCGTKPSLKDFLLQSLIAKKMKQFLRIAVNKISVSKLKTILVYVVLSIASILALMVIGTIFIPLAVKSLQNLMTSDGFISPGIIIGDDNNNGFGKILKTNDKCLYIHERPGFHKRKIIHDLRSGWSALVDETLNQCFLFRIQEGRVCEPWYPFDLDGRMGLMTPRSSVSKSTRIYRRVSRRPVYPISCAGPTIEKECSRRPSYLVFATVVNFVFDTWNIQRQKRRTSQTVLKLPEEKKKEMKRVESWRSFVPRSTTTSIVSDFNQNATRYVYDPVVHQYNYEFVRNYTQKMALEKAKETEGETKRMLKSKLLDLLSLMMSGLLPRFIEAEIDSKIPSTEINGEKKSLSAKGKPKTAQTENLKQLIEKKMEELHAPTFSKQIDDAISKQNARHLHKLIQLLTPVQDSKSRTMVENQSTRSPVTKIHNENQNRQISNEPRKAVPSDLSEQRRGIIGTVRRDERKKNDIEKVPDIDEIPPKAQTSDLNMHPHLPMKQLGSSDVLTAHKSHWKETSKESHEDGNPQKQLGKEKSHRQQSVQTSQRQSNEGNEKQESFQQYRKPSTPATRDVESYQAASEHVPPSYLVGSGKRRAGPNQVHVIDLDTAAKFPEKVPSAWIEERADGVHLNLLGGPTSVKSEYFD